MSQSFKVENRRAMLLISDGDFVDFPALEEQVAALRKERIRFHVLGVGTLGGGPLRLANGEWLRDSNGVRVTTALDEDQLHGLAAAGGGIYRRADFRDDDTQALLSEIAGDDLEKGDEEGRYRIWNERFYLPLAVVILLILPWFRRARGAATRIERG
jgi:Ca-activated chloride channel family protein